MNSFLYLVFVELLNSKVVFNRKYSKAKKILIFLAVNICMTGYLIRSNYLEKTNNLYDLFELQRDNYSGIEVKNVVNELTQPDMVASFSKEELDSLRIKAKTLLEPHYTKYYEVTGEVYRKQDNKDGNLEYQIEKDMRNIAISKTAFFYLISFVMFCVFFAVKESSVIKSVFIIGLIFVYVELQLLLSEDYQSFVESAVPRSRQLAAFEKVEFLRLFFHFFVHTAVGFARVLIDAEKKFDRDDKASFLKTMIEESKKINSAIINWDSKSFLQQEREKELAKEEEDKKKNKKGFCTYFGYFVLAWIVFGAVVEFFKEEDKKSSP